MTATMNIWNTAATNPGTQKPRRSEESSISLRRAARAAVKHGGAQPEKAARAVAITEHGRKQPV